MASLLLVRSFLLFLLLLSPSEMIRVLLDLVHHQGSVEAVLHSKVNIFITIFVRTPGVSKSTDIIDNVERVRSWGQYLMNSELGLLMNFS